MDKEEQIADFLGHILKGKLDLETLTDAAYFIESAVDKKMADSILEGAQQVRSVWTVRLKRGCSNEELQSLVSTEISRLLRRTHMCFEHEKGLS